MIKILLDGVVDDDEPKTKRRDSQIINKNGGDSTAPLSAVEDSDAITSNKEEVVRTNLQSVAEIQDKQSPEQKIPKNNTIKHKFNSS